MSAMHSASVDVQADAGRQVPSPSRWTQSCAEGPAVFWPCDLGAGALAGGGGNGGRRVKGWTLNSNTPGRELCCNDLLQVVMHEGRCREERSRAGPPQEEDRRWHGMEAGGDVLPVHALHEELEEQHLPPSPRKEAQVFEVSQDAQFRHCLSTMDEKLDKLIEDVSNCLGAISAISAIRPTTHRFSEKRSSQMAAETSARKSFRENAPYRRSSFSEIMCEDRMVMPYENLSRRPTAGPSITRRKWSTVIEESIQFVRGRRRSDLAERVWIFLEDPTSSVYAKWFGQAWVVVIGLAVLFTLLQTVEPPTFSKTAGAWVEMTFDVLFCVELLARFAVRATTWGFISSPYNLVDIAAALPLAPRATLGLMIPHDEPDLVGIILYCYVPVFRLLKLLRKIQLFDLFVRVLTSTLEALKFLLFLLLVVVLVFSSCLYLVEPRSNISDLPTAMWFTIVTMTTVGYGDLTPESTAGHGIVSVLIVGSVLYMAMPIGIIGNAFTQVWKERYQIQLTARTGARLLEWGYSTTDIPKLFQHFDRQNKGELNLTEFRQMVEFLCVGMQEEGVVELFGALDKNGNGCIDYAEFMHKLFPKAFLLIEKGQQEDLENS